MAWLGGRSAARHRVARKSERVVSWAARSEEIIVMPARVTARQLNPNGRDERGPRPHPNHGDCDIHASVCRVGSTSDLGCRSRATRKQRDSSLQALAARSSPLLQPKPREVEADDPRDGGQDEQPERLEGLHGSPSDLPIVVLRQYERRPTMMQSSRSNRSIRPCVSTST